MVTASFTTVTGNCFVKSSTDSSVLSSFRSGQEVKRTASMVCGDHSRPDIQPASPRIVGGTEALSGSLPWMAILAWRELMKCGGAILNDQFILTAAHCFDEPQMPWYPRGSTRISDPGNWTVYVGKHNVMRSNAGERLIRVEKILLHPGYDNRTYRNDLALVKVKGRVPFSPLIRPLCLPTRSAVPRVGQPCIVAGYGQTFSLETYSLHQVTVPVLSDEQCSQPDWHGDTFFPPDQLCAGYEAGGMDACLGDSGSPLICSFDGVWYANGIVSKGSGCAEPHKPGVYTNTSFHDQWITSTMTQHGLPPICL
ncbi:hypothetical protein ACOMHN_042776 [Nucella lapillus]